MRRKVTIIPYEVSKFLHLQMLLTPEELEMLFVTLGRFELFDNSRVLMKREPVSKEVFFTHYRKYFTSLSTQDRISIGGLALTDNPDHIYAMELGEGRVLLKPKEPIIQLREHTFVLSKDGGFLSGVHGEDVIRWGFELSFPQIFLDPETKCSHQVLRDTRFSNSQLFLRAMKWMRHHTRPVPFLVRGKLKRATFRIGLECFDKTKELFDIQKHTLSVRRGGQ